MGAENNNNSELEWTKVSYWEVRLLSREISYVQSIYNNVLLIKHSTWHVNLIPFLGLFVGLKHIIIKRMCGTANFDKKSTVYIHYKYTRHFLTNWI